MAECPVCGDLQHVFRIRTPYDLERAIAVARDRSARGEITQESEYDSDIWHSRGYGPWLPFSNLRATGPWPDNVLYTFRCETCGVRFRLEAETYHGSGGQREPLRSK
jgi:hypothetical protein